MPSVMALKARTAPYATAARMRSVTMSLNQGLPGSGGGTLLFAMSVQSLCL